MAKKKPKKGQKGYRAPLGIFGRLNALLRGVKIGLPALRSFTAGLSMGDAAKDAGSRYTGFDFESMSFDQGKATATAGFYIGNVVERKVLGALRIPQMAGRKKLLAAVGQYLPEIQAAGDLQAGASLQGVGEAYGQRSIGYAMANHQSWLEDANTRGIFFQSLFARAAMGLASRFVGPMVNKYLPKGVNI